MAIRTLYVCRECSAQTSRWQGKCISCNGWNTLSEQTIETKKKGGLRKQAVAVVVSGVTNRPVDEVRFSCGILECDRVLGNGLVEDSLVLLTGEPGIGKSTLALQMAIKMATNGKRVLYVSGEESVSQVSSRAVRLDPDIVSVSGFQLISETQLESVIETVKSVKPDVVIADSVQTLSSADVSSAAGTVSQVREVAEQFMHVSKKLGIATLLIGHVTKEGSLAGPKVLEHLVDTVLYLEGDRFHELRMLRASKNRFGATTEVGVFEMRGEGLLEVQNPSEIFLKGRAEASVGSVISVTIEGSRPFLIEVQALTNAADFSYPKRTASGIDQNRVQLLTAVLTKHAGVGLDQQDVYTNIAGGFRVQEPAMDLAIAAAIISSRLGVPLPPHVAVFGEIGLSGEVRPVTGEERRIKESEKLGFTEVWANTRSEQIGVRQIRSVVELRNAIQKLGHKRQSRSIRKPVDVTHEV